MRKVAILGSTGSIGRAAVEIIRQSREGEFEVVAIAAGRNSSEMSDQLEIFSDALFAMGDRKAFERLCGSGTGFGKRGVGSGQEGISELISVSRPDIVVNAMVGISGLLPTIKALETGCKVALANKESLVTGGELLMSKRPEVRDSIIPVDSEHFSLSRCLRGNRKEVKEVLITASGGPFFGRNHSALKGVKIEEVLNHPTWDMGDKVTVDSALLLNKGLEVIEAHWLFGIPYHEIGIIIHPQSIVHAIARMGDGSLLAHLAPPDMRLPIMSALYYPEIRDFPWDTLDLGGLGTLEFHEFRRESYPAFTLAMRAAESGGTAPVVLNAADEVAVNTFLSGKIGFTDIVDWIEEALSLHTVKELNGIEDVLEADRWARETLAGKHDEAVIV